MNTYLILYSEEAQMCHKKKHATIHADSKEQAEDKFRAWANRPSQYTRTMLAIYLKL